MKQGKSKMLLSTFVFAVIPILLVIASKALSTNWSEIMTAVQEIIHKQR